MERKSERWEGGVVDPKSQDAFLEVPPTSTIEGSDCNPYKALALQGRHSSGHFSCTSSPNPLGSLGGWGGTVIPVLWRRKLRHRAVQGNSPKATPNQFLFLFVCSTMSSYFFSCCPEMAVSTCGTSCPTGATTPFLVILTPYYS